jgi:hypothetical protein
LIVKIASQLSAMIAVFRLCDNIKLEVKLNGNLKVENVALSAFLKTKIRQ